MNINNLFPSKYLKSGDLEEDLTLTIKSIIQENIGQGEKQEVKPILYFSETEKGMVLNKTNANTISSLYGPETDAWPGKRITVFATEVDFAGKQTLALRVRMRQPGGNGDDDSQPASQKAWDAWHALVTDAAEMDVAPETVPTDGITTGELRKLYSQLKAAVKAATF
jgi:hypothetical protein